MYHRTVAGGAEAAGGQPRLHVLPHHQVVKRIQTFVLVLAVAFAYATGGTRTALTLRTGIPALTDAGQPALCPAIRPALQHGRQVDGRGGMLLAMPVALPPEKRDGLSATSWAATRLYDARVSRPAPLDSSSRSTRGPPTADLRYSEVS